MHKKFLFALFAALLGTASPCSAEIESSSEEDKQIFHEDLTEREKQLLMENIFLQKIVEAQRNMLESIEESEPSESREKVDREPGKPLDAALMQSILNESPDRIRTLIKRFKLAQENPNFRNILTTDRLLLVGPPGVGKTDLAKTIAHEIGRPFLFVQCSLLATEYQNSGAQNIKRTIEVIQGKKEPYVVILDEIHCLINKKKNDQRSDQDPAVALWQIIDECALHNNILFIGTTNTLTDMPDALKSRFSNAIIEVSLPGSDLRKRIIEFYSLNNQFEDALVADLVKRTAGYSCREIKELIREIMALTVQSGMTSPTTLECKQALTALRTARELFSTSSFTTKAREFVEKNGTLMSLTLSSLGFAMQTVNFIQQQLHIGPYAPQNK